MTRAPDAQRPATARVGAGDGVQPAPGTLDERQVLAMFDRIAGVYDRMNGVMTAGMHTRWRERAVAGIHARSTWPPAPATWRSP